MRSRIEPIEKSARALRSRLDEILSHSRIPIHTGMFEGFNNKVKVIKRLSYGFCDQNYFLLKITAHFADAIPPQNPRNPFSTNFSVSV